MAEDTSGSRQDLRGGSQLGQRVQSSRAISGGEALWNLTGLQGSTERRPPQVWLSLKINNMFLSGIKANIFPIV